MSVTVAFETTALFVWAFMFRVFPGASVTVIEVFVLFHILGLKNFLLTGHLVNGLLFSPSCCRLSITVGRFHGQSFRLSFCPS